MKAICVAKRGGPDVLEIREFTDPIIADAKDQLLIDVEAVGVNFADTVQTQGMYPDGPKPPYIPGLEFAGTIHGTDQRVMGFTRTGACAEKLVVHRSGVMPLPESWTPSEGAAFPVNYFTAYFGYWMAGMTQSASVSGRPKRILIHAVAGGVGTAAVQIGALLGIEMYGTSSSDEKLAQVQRLGLHHPINYREKEYEEEIAKMTNGEGVDAVFEMLGGEHTAMSTRCLGDMGRLIVYGMATGKPPQFDFMAMFQRNLSVHALWLTPLTAHADLMKEAFARLSGWISQGKLRPVIGAEFPLERTADAHRMLLDRRNLGKVVIRII